MAQRQQVGKKLQSKHGFVERFFRVTPTRNAAFISKLFSMVDDESTQDLITWTGSGDQFTVFNNTEFSRIVLPRYFKHCNWSSFVRQLNMYDFHKINENNNDEDLSNNTTEMQAQAQRWDFKHPWFNKAGFDRLHKIRRKPPRNRSIPQIRYSSAMEILPSNSPDYEQDTSGATSTSMMNSPSSNNNNNSGQSSSTSQNSPGVHDAISQLQDTADSLESKLEATANEVQYLRKVTESQQEILNDLLASVDYLKSKYNISDNIFNTPTRKPRKIHELLGSNTESQNIEFKQYQMESTRHELQHHQRLQQDDIMEEIQGNKSTSRNNTEK